MHTVLAYLMFLLTGMVMQSQSSVEVPEKNLRNDNEHVRIYDLESECFQRRGNTCESSSSICMDNKLV